MGLSGLLACCLEECRGSKNEFVFNKYEKDSNTYDYPSASELIGNKNIRHAFIHNQKETVYVGHDDSGKAYTGCIKHRNEYEASHFINKGLPALISNCTNNTKLLKEQ